MPSARHVNQNFPEPNVTQYVTSRRLRNAKVDQNQVLAFKVAGTGFVREFLGKDAGRREFAGQSLVGWLSPPAARKTAHACFHSNSRDLDSFAARPWRNPVPTSRNALQGSFARKVIPLSA